MRLVLQGCIIRPWRLDDAESLAKHANNRRIWLGLRDLFPHPYGIEDAQEFIERVPAENEHTNFSNDIRGSAVGGIGLRLGQDVHRHAAEFGYWLSEDFWRRGVMSE